jgi:hypothetical protein
MKGPTSSKMLDIDHRIRIIGTRKQIAEVESLIIQQLSSIKHLNEADARMQLQAMIDAQSIKADLLFQGNGVWSYNKTIEHLERVIEQGMDHLSEYLYNFFSLCCGTIAHYSRLGWIDKYPDLEALRGLFRHNEFGERVLEHIPAWKTDVKRIVVETEKLLGIEEEDEKS